MEDNDESGKEAVEWETRLIAATTVVRAEWIDVREEDGWSINGCWCIVAAVSIRVTVVGASLVGVAATLRIVVEPEGAKNCATEEFPAFLLFNKTKL